MERGAGEALHRAYLSLGANLGDRRGSIARALKLIASSPGLLLLRVSSLYATEPVGYLDQPEFINCAAIVDSALPAERLLGRLRAIERLLGRRQRQKWRAREIDIDIILFNDATIATDELTIPHPQMQHRAFVLLPLAEIAPDAIHPLLRKSVCQLLDDCSDITGIRKLDDDVEEPDHLAM